MFIYLIQKGQSTHYKIGITKSIGKRLLSLQTSNSEPLSLTRSFETLHDYKLEKFLHNFFRGSKLEGEWFDLTEEEVKDFLNTCKKGEEVFKNLSQNNSYYQDKVLKK